MTVPQRISADGSTIAVTRHGRGPAVVCLHAAGHGARDFARLAQRLGDRFELVCLDWHGHGASAPDGSPVTAAHYAGIVDTVVDSLALRPAAIIGNSIGGAAALVYAVRRPDRVPALVLCNPAGLQPVGLIARLVCRRMAAFFARGERHEAGYAARFRRYYERDVLSAPAAAWRRDEIVATAEATAGLLRRAWEGFARPEADLRSEAAKVRCPVLFAWAKGDRYVAWRRSQRAARAVPRHVVRLLAGSHCAFLEDPERFEQEFLIFMADATVRPSSSHSIDGERR